MSACVDKILQPFLPKIPGYFLDITQSLRCISKIKYFPRQALIVSMDVKTLYSSIPHSDGIKACEIFMIESGLTSMEISNITIIIEFF